jgi:lipopolysaccharide transport system permease protein
VKGVLRRADNSGGDEYAVALEVPCRREEEPKLSDHRSPVFVIRSNRSTGLHLRDLWSHRGLFYILAWRDVKVRYKQSALGAAWVILQPLLTMLIFTLLFGRLARMSSEGEPYAIFSYAGLLPWTFFSTAVSTSSNSLVNNSNLITKVYFPRMLIPTATVGAGLIDLAIASLMLLVLIPIYRVGFHLSLIMFLPLVALTALAATAIGILTSALNVKYRDIRHALPFVIQVWMFLTPVIYSVNFLPERWRWLLSVNPLTGIIEGFRAAIFGSSFDWQGLGISTTIVITLLVMTAYSFSRMEEQFADVI